VRLHDFDGVISSLFVCCELPARVCTCAIRSILLGDAFVESDDSTATELVASRKEVLSLRGGATRVSKRSCCAAPLSFAGELQEASRSRSAARRHQCAPTGPCAYRRAGLAARAKMLVVSPQELKKALYGRFRNTINLEVARGACVINAVRSQAIETVLCAPTSVRVPG
jgi:hypothetical protein